MQDGKGDAANSLKKTANGKGRTLTVLRSKLGHVDLRPMVDADKNYFLNEFLKLLSFAENYLKQK